MNLPIIIKVIGRLLLIEALALSLPLLVAMYYGDGDTGAFVATIVICVVIGFLCSIIPSKNHSIKIKEGLAVVTFGWLAFSVFGALPFMFSGAIPSFADALFETISGFTTTGASILNEIEGLPRGILFWRSFTHWLGGMGILVFTIAIMPKMGAGSFQIIKAESPGPVSEKVVPRVKDTAIILYTIYIGVTILEIVLFMLGDMSLYDASVHAFGTVGTGGFSTKNTSVGYYSPYIQWVITIFMFASGTNFALYYLMFKGKFKKVLQDEEWRFYTGIVLIATAIICMDLTMHNIYGEGFFETIRHSAFQVVAIVTTTGYSTADFDQWPAVSKATIMGLFFVGGCAGSTGGSIKNIRLLVAVKSIGNSISKVLHPRAVLPVKINGKTVGQDTVFIILNFIVLWGFITLFGTIIVSLDGYPLLDSFSAVVATFCNVGPGFGVVGPTCNFSIFSDGIKYFLSFLMLIGRLEMYTVLALFAPRFWGK